MSVSLLDVVEVAAVASFAYSGAETARRLRMDVVGLAALAVVNGLAGGIVRDVLIGQPVLAVHDARLLPTCLVVAVVVMVFVERVEVRGSATCGACCHAAGRFASFGSAGLCRAGRSSPGRRRPGSVSDG